MKHLLLLITISFPFSSSLLAMDSDLQGTPSSVVPHKPTVKYAESRTVKWEELNRYISRGVSLTVSPDGSPLPEGYRIPLEETLSMFPELFRGIKSTSRKKLDQRKYLNNLLSQFYFYVLYAQMADNHYLREHGRASESPFGAADRRTALANKPIRDQFFNELQPLTNSVFKALEDGGVQTFRDPEGLFSANQDGLFGYMRDQGGYIPFVARRFPYLQIVNITWGQYPSEHQPNFLIDGDKIRPETGLVFEVTDRAHLKVRGVLGANTEFPYTAHRITLRIPLLDQLPLFQLFKSVIPGEFARPRANLDHNPVHLLPFPETPLDWKMVELLFLEDLQKERNESSSSNSLLLENCRLLEDETPLEDQTSQLSSSLLSDYEARIKAEQEDRSRRLQEGTLFPQKKVGKKKRGKGKAQNVATVASADNQKNATKEELFAAYKVESRQRYREVLRLLRNVMAQLPSDKIRHVVMRGSHVTVHGESGGFTLVKPHGGQDDLSAFTVNRILLKIIQLGQSSL